jgi:acyl dehydratase/NAD(P)-dependent dehydrogenase (short-subunit alcohol dehydrogenase family)
MLASRTFGAEDQARFAAMSGDFNPIHVDPVAARRTYAGETVVHGMHLLIWLLDAIKAQFPDISQPSALKVRFREPVYLGQRVDVTVVKHSSDSIRVNVLARSGKVLELTASLGLPSTVAAAHSFTAKQVPRSAAPRDLSFEEAANESGQISFALTCSSFAAAFPHAASLMGAERVAALACSSFLVGMVVPGLHSIYGGLNLALADADGTAQLNFAVTSVDARIRRVLLQIEGGGLSGTIEAFGRVPPVAQISVDLVSSFVDAGEAGGSVSLIIGGSRGLGEVTANLIAAGGGKVIITYAAGALDARKVADGIRAWGGQCAVSAYNVWHSAEQQCRELPETPTHIYYFATPNIARRLAGFCSRERLEEFHKFYVHGFLELLDAAQALGWGGISVFYPSSTFVEQRPPGMIEYAMAKAAGELLCAEINRFRPGIRIITRRLPRVLTDQTVSLIQRKSEDAVAVMLPIVRMMQLKL